MKKGLIAVLIAANLLMLVLGILTIPPNLRSAATGKKPPVIKTEQTTPVTPSPKGETPPATTESGGTPCAGGNRRGLIHGGTPRSVGLSLVHGGRSL